jgi:RimJ/RimL family protein N-acetyltransferase
VNIEIERIDGETWSQEYSDDWHTADFALVSKVDGEPSGYVQCIEMNKSVIYWQFGGAREEFRKKLSVLPCYSKMIQWTAERYKRIETRIENNNLPMLHLAMKAGFRAVGTRTVRGRIFLELIFERENHA